MPSKGVLWPAFLVVSFSQKKMLGDKEWDNPADMHRQGRGSKRYLGLEQQLTLVQLLSRALAAAPSTSLPSL
jgi:hypothetical protein